MLISKELAAAINEQITHEMIASQQYAQIATYFDGLALTKLAKMFYKQSDEERQHAFKFLHYLSETGAEIALEAIAAPKHSFASVEEAVKLSVDWEWEVTRRINALMDIAVQQKDYLAQDFLRWFVTEQLEEITTMETLLKVVQQAGSHNLFMIQGYLAHED